MWMYSLLFLVFLFGATAAQPFSSDGEQHPQDRDVHGSKDTRRWLGDLNSVLVGMSSDHDSEVVIDEMEDQFNPVWNGNRVLHFAPRVNCDQTLTTCLSFLNELTKSVVSRKSTTIRKHFSKFFHFKGCLKIYNLDDIVAMLVGVPAGTGVFNVFQGAKVYDNNHTKHNATIHGVLPRPFNATFILVGKTKTLLEGQDTECLNL